MGRRCALILKLAYQVVAKLLRNGGCWHGVPPLWRFHNPPSSWPLQTPRCRRRPRLVGPAEQPAHFIVLNPTRLVLPPLQTSRCHQRPQVLAGSNKQPARLVALNPPPRVSPHADIRLPPTAQVLVGSSRAARFVLRTHPLLKPHADIPLLPTAQVLVDVEEEQKAKEPEKWNELGLQSVG